MIPEHQKFIKKKPIKKNLIYHPYTPRSPLTFVSTLILPVHPSGFSDSYRPGLLTDVVGLISSPYRVYEISCGLYSS